MLKKMPNKDIAKIVLVRRQKNPYLFIAITLLIVIIALSGFLILKKKVDYVAYKDVKIGSEVFKLEVADDEAARERGLSERDFLPANTGMLFDFKTDSDWRMWMLKMRFDIDIAWLDKTGKVVFIKTDATPGSYPEAFHAGQPSRYVIEAPPRTFENLGIKPGYYIKVN